MTSGAPAPADEEEDAEDAEDEESGAVCPCA